MSQQISGTEVVCLTQKPLTILAADSLLLVKEHGVTRRENICKIHQYGAHFWSVSGFTSTTNRTFAFDIDDIVRKAIDNHVSPAKTMELISADARLSLQWALPYLRRTSPEFYERATRKGNGPLSLMVVFITNHASVETHWIDFFITNGQIVPSKVQGCDGICITVLGEPKARDYVATHPESQGGEAVPVIDKLMQIGEIDEPELIGGPISILDITPDHAVWSRQNNCRAIEPYNARMQ